jgi:ubiquitin-protein ligase
MMQPKVFTSGLNFDYSTMFENKYPLQPEFDIGFSSNGIFHNNIDHDDSLLSTSSNGN